eukprot:TRINITY_DN2252_c0_g1_i2.p2 TRINITY_DN2252_c0_g1~~TRINITY_DN2252_c0_g1_i2.p2  ORF type:complete len:227 (-),score=12.49 TRINITY_DN2252_c0_g1_i2:158-838(-)
MPLLSAFGGQVETLRVLIYYLSPEGTNHVCFAIQCFSLSIPTRTFLASPNVDPPKGNRSNRTFPFFHNSNIFIPKPPGFISFHRRVASRSLVGTPLCEIIIPFRVSPTEENVGYFFFFFFFGCSVGVKHIVYFFQLFFFFFFFRLVSPINLSKKPIHTPTLSTQNLTTTHTPLENLLSIVNIRKFKFGTWIQYHGVYPPPQNYTFKHHNFYLQHIRLFIFTQYQIA